MMRGFVRNIVIICFLFAAANNLFAIDKWVKLASPTHHNLYKSCFLDTSNGWVCGDSGTIIHTSNGGLNWGLQNTNADFAIVYITFLNKNLGWAVGNLYIYFSPAIFSTTNGGINWNLNYYSDSTQMFNTIYFLDSLNGYIGGYGGLILKTTNSGVNWMKTQSDSSLFAHLTIKNFHFINSVTGFACGGRIDLSGVIWETTNGGYFWQTTSISPEPLNQFIFFDTLNAVAVGGDYDFGSSVVTTSNSGANWKYNPLPFLGIGFTIGNRTNSEWWVGLGYALTFLYTTDYGKTWRDDPLPDSTGIYDIVFPDSTHGWAFGFYGSVLKYTGTSVGINNEGITIKEFKLYQNYPNPFNPSTTIKFSIPESSSKITSGRNIVTLKIYDILGKEVATLVNEGLQAGTYEVPFFNRQMPSGIYFYRLTYGNYADTKKMLLIK